MFKLLWIVAVIGITASIIVGLGSTVNGMTLKYRESVETAASVLETASQPESASIW